MQLRHLKQLRVVIAVIFFVLITFLFLDFREIGSKTIAQEVLFLQFVPSLLDFLNGLAIGATGFLIVLAITLLFGRVYCSTICPLGTLQDLISRLSRKTLVKRRKRKGPHFAASKAHSFLRYSVLALTLLLFAAGSGLLLNLLDPFSNFGRIVSNLVRPLVLAANNLSAPVAEQLGSQAVYLVRWPAIAPTAIAVSLALLLLVGWLSARHGRLYCNTLCPVGTLLGLLSKLSLYRIRFDRVACKECGRCVRVCKTGCIDIESKTIDVTRCVDCYNCLAVCPDQALNIGGKGDESGPKTESKGQSSPTRRLFLLGLATSGLSLIAGRTNAAPAEPPIQSRPTTIPENKTSPLSPPGSQSIKHFTSVCTACHLCVSACPSRVLVPSVLGYGLSGFLQPQMDFGSGHCNFDCTTCSEVCPSGAILPLSKETKQRTQVGVAKFIKENCVVYMDNTNCGACSEHCPTKAVHMVPYLNAIGRKLVIPEVNEAICVGCGGCEHACPTKPYKAIYVEGNTIHKIAEKPVETKLEPETDSTEDFPF